MISRDRLLAIWYSTTVVNDVTVVVKVTVLVRNGLYISSVTVVIGIIIVVYIHVIAHSIALTGQDRTSLDESVNFSHLVVLK